MAEIPIRVLDQIRVLGLHFFRYPTEHVFPDGIRVFTHLEEVELEPGEIIEVGNGPSVIVYGRDAAHWYTESVDGCGGFLPGDFFNCWPCMDAALEDLLDFYQWNSFRLKAKERHTPRSHKSPSNPALPAEVIDRLQQSGIVEVARYPVDSEEFQISFSRKDPETEYEPKVRLYGWKSGVCCVDARSKQTIEEDSLASGEFMHYWRNYDDALDDMVDFFYGSKIRRLAWIEGKKLEQ
jgi:hypothetical protein